MLLQPNRANVLIRPRHQPTESCRGSGILPRISTWETGRSQPAVICARGGRVTNVPVGCCTSGRPASIKGRIGQSVPFLHQQKSVPTQLALDCSPGCCSMLGYSQEWADCRPGHCRQLHPQALALLKVWSQLASQRICQSQKQERVSEVLGRFTCNWQAAKLDTEQAPCNDGV